MGKFDGILLCSDFDSTLTNSSGEISDKNIKAINYFKENGGLFTICTGRSPNYFLDNKEKGSLINTVLIGLNGAMIYDTKNRKILYENPINKEELDDIEKFILDNKELIEHIDYHCDIVYNSFDEVEDKKLYKILFVSPNEESSDMLRIKFRKMYGEQFFLTNSWPEGLEVLDKTGTKGECVRIIRNYIDKKIDKVICVGDYENDITMLKQADISYAVANARPLVQASATNVTVSCDKSPFVHIIADIEKNL